MANHLQKLLLINLLIVLACSPQNSDKGNEKVRDTSAAKQSPITLANGAVALNLPKGFAFIPRSELSPSSPLEPVENPHSLGIIYRLDPNHPNPNHLNEGIKEFVDITYDEVGYIEDHDKNDINTGTLGKRLLEDYPFVEEEDDFYGFENGYAGLTGLPDILHFDAARHQLSWTSTIKTVLGLDTSRESSVYLLGRHGVLRLDVVDELSSSSFKLWELQNIATFIEGHRYSDFNKEVDPIAKMTMTDLVIKRIETQTGKHREPGHPSFEGRAG